MKPCKSLPFVPVPRFQLNDKKRENRRGGGGGKPWTVVPRKTGRVAKWNRLDRQPVGQRNWQGFRLFREGVSCHSAFLSRGSRATSTNLATVKAYRNTSSAPTIRLVTEKKGRRRRGDGPIRRSLHVFAGWIPGGGRHPVPSRAQSTSVRLAAWQTGCSWTCIWNAADKRVSLTAESISFLPVSGIERNSNRWGRERQRQREWRRLGKGLIRRDGREGGEGLSKKNDGENVMMRRGTRIFKMFYTWKFIVSLFWIGKEFVWSIIKQFYLTTSMIIEFKW